MHLFAAFFAALFSFAGAQHLRTVEAAPLPATPYEASRLERVEFLAPTQPPVVARLDASRYAGRAWQNKAVSSAPTMKLASLKR